jgi:hypothetical protein
MTAGEMIGPDAGNRDEPAPPEDRGVPALKPLPRGDGPVRLGRRRAGLDAGWQLRRHPPHPDEPRGLGPLGAGGPAETGGVGAPVIPRDAHVRLASATENDGVRILPRGYSFTDGSTRASASSKPASSSSPSGAIPKSSSSALIPAQIAKGGQA